MLTCWTRYTTSFAHRLAEAVHAVVPIPTKDANVAYICCPTGHVASQYLHYTPDTLLLEYDKRFAIAAGVGHFIHYVLESDEQVPEDIKGSVELAIVDPPFLNEVGHQSSPNLSCASLTLCRLQIAIWLVRLINCFTLPGASLF
jgi:hypothetical protein